MSAFSVSDKHINVLVAFAKQQTRGSKLYTCGTSYDLARTTEARNLGDILRQANGASLLSKYGKGDFDYFYEEENIKDLSVADIVSLCHCYEYQACEFNGWSSSAARNAIIAIKDLALDTFTKGKSELWGI